MALKIMLAALLMGAAGPSWGATQHQVTDKDHLWGLAGKYYNDHFCWRAIYEANQERIKDPHWIYPAQVLDIPASPKCERPEPTPVSLPVAAPVEVSAPVMVEPVVAQAPEPEPVLEPEPEPVPAPKPAPPPQPAYRWQTEESLAREMPGGLTGQEVWGGRVDFPEGWKGDGEATVEGMASVGEEFPAKIKVKGGVSAGTRFTIYRRAARLESEKDKPKKTVFLQAIGAAEVVERTGKSQYRLKVVKAGTAVWVGDILKLER